MTIIDHFQTKCPVCKKKLQPKALASPKPFSSQPVPAGQCHECKTDMQWIRSRQKVLVMAAAGALFVILFTIVFTAIKGGTTQTAAQIVGQILGISAVLGFLNGKELAQTPNPPGE